MKKGTRLISVLLAICLMFQSPFSLSAVADGNSGLSVSDVLEYTDSEYVRNNLSYAGGFIATSGDWVYYLNRGEHYSLYAINLRTEKKLKITDYPVANMNVSDGNLYYTDVSATILNIPEDIDTTDGLSSRVVPEYGGNLYVYEDASNPEKGKEARQIGEDKKAYYDLDFRQGGKYFCLSANIDGAPKLAYEALDEEGVVIGHLEFAEGDSIVRKEQNGYGELYIEVSHFENGVQQNFIVRVDRANLNGGVSEVIYGHDMQMAQENLYFINNKDGYLATVKPNKKTPMIVSVLPVESFRISGNDAIATTNDGTELDIASAYYGSKTKYSLKDVNGYVNKIKYPVEYPKPMKDTMNTSARRFMRYRRNQNSSAIVDNSITVLTPEDYENNMVDEKEVRTLVDPSNLNGDTTSQDEDNSAIDSNVTSDDEAANQDASTTDLPKVEDPFAIITPQEAVQLVFDEIKTAGNGSLASKYYNASQMSAYKEYYKDFELINSLSDEVVKGVKSSMGSIPVDDAGLQRIADKSEECIKKVFEGMKHSEELIQLSADKKTAIVRVTISDYFDTNLSLPDSKFQELVLDFCNATQYSYNDLAYQKPDAIIAFFEYILPVMIVAKNATTQIDIKVIKDDTLGWKCLDDDNDDYSIGMIITPEDGKLFNGNLDGDLAVNTDDTSTGDDVSGLANNEQTNDQLPVEDKKTTETEGKVSPSYMNVIEDVKLEGVDMKGSRIYRADNPPKKMRIMFRYDFVNTDRNKLDRFLEWIGLDINYKMDSGPRSLYYDDTDKIILDQDPDASAEEMTVLYLNRVVEKNNPRSISETIKSVGEGIKEYFREKETSDWLVDEQEEQKKKSDLNSKSAGYYVGMGIVEGSKATWKFLKGAGQLVASAFSSGNSDDF